MPSSAVPISVWMYVTPMMPTAVESQNCQMVMPRCGAITLTIQ